MLLVAAEPIGKKGDQGADPIGRCRSHDDQDVHIGRKVFDAMVSVSIEPPSGPELNDAGQCPEDPVPLRHAHRSHHRLHESAR